MRINSLYIDDYKLLKNFTINFSKDISILIGINGSGKSSILECVAQIFSDAYLQEKSKFRFKVEYELQLEAFVSKKFSPNPKIEILTIKVEIFAEKKGEKLQYKLYIEDMIFQKKIRNFKCVWEY